MKDLPSSKGISSMHLSVVDNFKDEAALSKEIMRSILTEDVKIVIVARILEEECKRSAF